MTKPDSEKAVRIDIERMEKSLQSGTIKVPPGLSKEETLAFILSHAKQEEALQFLVDQAQELDMGYGENACPECGRSNHVCLPKIKNQEN